MINNILEYYYPLTFPSIKNKIAKKRFILDRYSGVTPKIGEKKWWDKECRESKKRLNRVLRQMKRGKIERRRYTEERRKHNKLRKEAERRKRKRAEKDNGNNQCNGNLEVHKKEERKKKEAG